ncbi:MAG: cytochrome c biogenesis heme-transporting ATPase CcmA [Halieaceae bacterium]
MSEPLINASGLCLERGGRQLLSNFELQVGSGELVLIEGANGSGKTTLLRSLAGLSELGQAGTITRNCEQLLYLGHKFGIKLQLSPAENLHWFCHSQGLDPAGINSALDRVGLYGYEDVLCQSLSAGQQRRVNLARLYLSSGGLWLLDEPFTAIDRDGVKALTQTLIDQVAGGGSVVLTSHQDLPLDVPLRRVILGATA